VGFLLTPSTWAVILLLSAAGTTFSFAKYKAGEVGLDEMNSLIAMEQSFRY
jgi:hypothetical protein